MSQNTLDTGIEFLKGVGPKKADMLKKEMAIFTFRDLVNQFPFRYIDKTQFHKSNELRSDSGDVQIRGVLRRLSTAGDGRKKRLVGVLRDETGTVELVWFRGVNWVEKSLSPGSEYVAYGRVNEFNGRFNIPHPEMEEVTAENTKKASSFAPVYPSTEKLNQRGLDPKSRRRIMATLFEKLTEADFPENLPGYLVERLKFPSHYEAVKNIHFPTNAEDLKAARNRLKFEELFFIQMRLLQMKVDRKSNVRGFQFARIGDNFNRFYQEKIPFELTGAQKRVIKEIRTDLGAGIHMNRLLQGDVGSGKTMVGLMCMLIALDNGFQTCLMAPTEILAQQHFISIKDYVEGLDVNVEFLSGTVKGKKRKGVLERLASGEIDILLGTHALIEDPVVFKNLGLAITDEQHRFGVKQRAKLWKKNKPYPPHVLVMTATPIPRTLAMTLYGDLDVSVIDELPPGRKPVTTIHKFETNRTRVFGFMKDEIKKGRQVYVVYPLIQESETLDLKNLEDGYEALSREFPLPDYKISVLHGKMKPADKEFEMQRFAKGETQIMVATTVIEVGVNVPNASVMVIENTERFGLSQLHQLRGRVGRGADQSFCILMSSYKLSAEAKERISTMTSTNDGFKISEADLKLRGPGNIQGTQQSGVLNLQLANLATDSEILKGAREIANRILDKDPTLDNSHNRPLKVYLARFGKNYKTWSQIS